MRSALTAPIALLVLALSACSSTTEAGPGSDPDSDTAEAVEATETESEAAFDGDQLADEWEAELATQLGGRTPAEACDPTDFTWLCALDGVEAMNESSARLVMSVPGDVDADDVSETGRTAFFNLVGSARDDLETVVSYVDGVDTGTTYRRDLPLLN